MIVAAGDGHNGRMLIVGLTEADIETMRSGQTKTKQGNEQYGFSSMVVFMGKSDQEMISLLSQQSTVRHDDLFPDAGSG